MKNRCTTVFVVLAVSVIVSAQDVHITPKPDAPIKPAAAPATAFEIGMSKESVESIFGAPESYFAAAVQRSYSFYPDGTGGLVWRIYRRFTKLNEYEISVLYDVDDTKSRLHPTLRVQEIRFKMDKLRSVRETLQDLPEFIKLCEGGCRLMSVQETLTRSSTYPRLFIFREGADNGPKLSANLETTPPGMDAAAWLSTKTGEISMHSTPLRLVTKYTKSVDLGEMRPEQTKAAQ